MNDGCLRQVSEHLHEVSTTLTTNPHLTRLSWFAVLRCSTVFATFQNALLDRTSPRLIENVLLTFAKNCAVSRIVVLGENHGISVVSAL
jgi:carbon monoxide dehydrogenase subunit G